MHEVLQELERRYGGEPDTCALCDKPQDIEGSDVCLDCQKLLRWIET